MKFAYWGAFESVAGSPIPNRRAALNPTTTTSTPRNAPREAFHGQRIAYVSEAPTARSAVGAPATRMSGVCPWRTDTRIPPPTAEMTPRSTAETYAYPVTVWEQAFVPNTLEAQDGDYMAAGSFNQIIYVSPRTRTVVAHHGISADITTEYIDMFRLFMAFREIGHSLL